MPKKNYTLIVVHRPGSEYEADFGEICAKVEALDPQIAAYSTDALSQAPVSESEWQKPTLVVSLLEAWSFRVVRGTVLCNYEIDKLGQTKILRKAGLPTPPDVPFRPGMRLDPIMFGEFVLIKPMNLRMTSKGVGIQVMRRRRLEQLRPIDLPADHPLRRTAYIVQKLVNTGEFPTTYRVTTFLGELIYALRYQSLVASPDLTAPDSVIEAGNFSQKGERQIELFENDELFSLARKVAGAFDMVPLLGIDFVRDYKSMQPYILEVNAGGNTWHFASRMWAERRRQSPELIHSMKEQFSVYDAAARGLVAKTRQLAS
jgi:glutathione synthase/RimK-type ligase-like ATP-grasp enzyme